MQDPLAVAEAMRIPFVMYVGQRGGPSTGTVIYSQQELNMARFGGNGEGMRIVLGPSNLQELYDHTIKAFDWAWRYHLPVIVLGDGYLSKMTGTVELKRAGKVTPAKPIVQNGQKVMNMRNCYSQESELGQVLHRELKDFAAISSHLAEAETYKTTDAEVVVYAWGSVGSAAREAVKKLRTEGYPVGLFRPITLRPFAATRAKIACSTAKKILIAESSFGQFGRLVTESLFGTKNIPIERLYKPAEGITSEEIEKKLREML
jgi:2-oxoglutarate/2-oxoacid ferredoxin oxidoreductase subunit alpha